MHVNFQCIHNKRLTCDEVFLQRMFQSFICCHGWATRSIPPRNSEVCMGRLPNTASCRPGKTDFIIHVIHRICRTQDKTRDDCLVAGELWDNWRKFLCRVLYVSSSCLCGIRKIPATRPPRWPVERLFDFFYRFLQWLKYRK